MSSPTTSESRSTKVNSAHTNSPASLRGYATTNPRSKLVRSTSRSLTWITRADVKRTVKRSRCPPRRRKRFPSLNWVPRSAQRFVHKCFPLTLPGFALAVSRACPTLTSPSFLLSAAIRLFLCCAALLFCRFAVDFLFVLIVVPSYAVSGWYRCLPSML